MRLITEDLSLLYITLCSQNSTIEVMLTKEIITITSKNDLTQVKAIQILMRVLLGKHPVPLFKVMNE